MSFEPKIFGIGLSKTGTTTLFAALNELGVNCITYRHLVSRGLDEWRAGRFERDYLADVDAATDLPIGTWYKELDKLYPGSKFILTERPVDPWLASIESQFDRTPAEPGSFREDVRIATYGSAVFDAAKYARAFAEHAAGIRAHFADRPDDLLIQNYFEGDGWDTLCAFLDKPAPAIPFPNVKPGFRPASNGAKAPIAFVLPVIHPDAPTVSDYGRIEQVLRLTLDSIAAQAGGPGRTVVVCHRKPDWADAYANVTFLVIPDIDAFRPGAHHRHADKGMKYALGCWYAMKAWSPDLLMPMDSDDFLHRSLTPRIREYMSNHGDIDGVRFDQGYHAQLTAAGERIEANALYKISGYYHTCGTSRVFRSAAVERELLAFYPELAEFDADEMIDIGGVLHEDLLQYLKRRTDEDGQEKEGFPRTFGNHLKPAPYFKVVSAPLALAAKGCGHDNHVGPRSGAIHWHRVVAAYGPEKLLKEFGLGTAGAVVPKPDRSRLLYWRLRSRLRAVVHRFRR